MINLHDIKSDDRYLAAAKYWFGRQTPVRKVLSLEMRSEGGARILVLEEGRQKIIHWSEMSFTMVFGMMKRNSA